jgi:hypothetical protein
MPTKMVWVPSVNEVLLLQREPPNIKGYVARRSLNTLLVGEHLSALDYVDEIAWRRSSTNN